MVNNCSIDNCDAPVKGRGWCKNHYQRWWRNGDPNKLKSLQDRFDEKYIIDENGCWLWTSELSHNGYGRFKINGKRIPAHRFSYVQKYGSVPKSLELDHLCRVRKCCNPDHVEPVTHKVNMQRGNSGKFQREITHCPQGHHYSGDNLYVHPATGKRKCKTCRAQMNKKYYWRKKTQNEGIPL